MEQLADSLKVPPEQRAAFAEVYECQGSRGAKNYKTLLAKVRSDAEVRAAIDAKAASLLPADALAEGLALDRLIFCGRYSAKAGTPLDDALAAAAAGVVEARKTMQAIGGRKQLAFSVAPGKFGDEHLACREAAFPYRPSVSASHGSAVLEARASQPVADVVAAGALLGYVAMQGGGYVDDIGVLPKFHGQGVATGLLCAAAAAEVKGARRGSAGRVKRRSKNSQCNFKRGRP